MDFTWREITLSGLVVLVLLLWQFSQLFRYVCRYALYSFWVTFSSTVFIPIFIFRPRDIRNMDIARFWFKKTFWVFGYKAEVRNLSNMEYDKPCIIVCNHQSIIDVIGMIEVIPPRTTALAKKELLYAGPFGIATWLGGMIFVDRLNRSKAHETMERAAKIILEKNVKLWIFPEGTRHNGDELLPFKKGAFHLAVQAQIPIFPVVFSSYKDFLDNKARKFDSGKVIITCLPKVDTAGLTLESVTALADNIRTKMNDVFIATSVEVHQQAAVLNGGPSKSFNRSNDHNDINKILEKTGTEKPSDANSTKSKTVGLSNAAAVER